ncbi:MULTISPECIES: hypothetical protein [unclassified Streptomyces]|uniref:hypothetical protein n=1 Tax=unclassified Streptomyces TaxID=2593676 RepID=UPI001BEC7928|nr:MULTISPECIES: hypothetical protein [unclassified Streptomyces]MBT2405564.1 hypothetical protein [Streptomyces sp. ISL-21]MBT2607756.1 hypothetical protein [Streptomyces sp. ISL-87]
MLQNDSAASPCLNLGDAIREIAPTAVLARVFPERRAVTHLFESDFYRMLIDRQTEERVARMIRRNFGDAADWRRAHDFYLPTGTLHLAPEPHQNGYVPEDDHSFGLALTRRIAISDGSD